jgi:hypothetical protein
VVSGFVKLSVLFILSAWFLNMKMHNSTSSKVLLQCLQG